MLKMELSRCIGLSSPGPHCFLLVMESTRFTSEEENCINQFADMFGNNFFHYVIVVFTRKDDLDREKKTIREYLEEADDTLKDLIKKNAVIVTLLSITWIKVQVGKIKLKRFWK